jgi:hypothetical protein
MLTREAVSAEAWVCDGNYSPVRDIVWGPGEYADFLELLFYIGAQKSTLAHHPAGLYPTEALFRKPGKLPPGIPQQ